MTKPNIKDQKILIKINRKVKLKKQQNTWIYAGEKFNV